MARDLLAGSWLNSIAGSELRRPAWQVLVWDPACTTMTEVATNTWTTPPVDLTPFIQAVDVSENIGHENGDNPSVTEARFTFRRSPAASGPTMRRGLIDDGVIVRILQGDRRIKREDWIPIFTGFFRGRPGEDPGTRADVSEGFEALAFGREERFLNLVVTTKTFDQGTDIGAMAVHVAQRHMGLTQDEILFGDQGFLAKHLTNQIVEQPVLSALWQLLFTVGKKPKFDGRGRLRAVDVRLDKPAVRIYGEDNFAVRSQRAQPNDVEVNNSVVLKGLSSELSKALQQSQLLTEFTAVTGYFDSSFEERIYYSQDRTDRAQETFLTTRKRIRWSDASWSEADEFHGVVEIDTRFLRDARITIFVIFLALQIAVSALDFAMQTGGQAVANAPVPGLGITIATLREILHVTSLIAFAALIWAMNFIGRGEYEVHGRRFEFVYQELVSRHRLAGLQPEERRELELRNDLLSTIEDLDTRAKDLLRRELVKNQVHAITVLDDPLLEVDDIVDLSNGDRFYITTVNKRLERTGAVNMQLTAWQIASIRTKAVEAATLGSFA